MSAAASNGLHRRTVSEPPPSLVLLKQSLVCLPEGVEVIAPQEPLSLSTSQGETKLMVDLEGNLRDELGFLLLDTASVVTGQPPGPLLPQGTAMTPGYQTTPGGILGGNQRKLWDELLELCGGSLHSLSRAELNRWRKSEVTSPTIAPTVTAIAMESEPTSMTESKRRLSFRFRRPPSNLPPTPVPTPPSSFRMSNRTTTGKQLTQLIRTHGIPTELRNQVWFACCGAEEKQRLAGPREQYSALVGTLSPTLEPSADAIQIERDLHRTFPTNYLYQKDEGIASLRQVLLAYSLRNPQVGYCQSMNFLVGTLLLHMTEEEAFWVLASIVEDLVPGYFAPQMVGVHVDQWVFYSLVKSRFPKLTKHLDELDPQLLSMVSYQWFLCLFVNSLPLGTALRVWDSFLHEGSKVLFRVGLTIVRMLSKELLQCECFSDAYEVLTLGPKDRKRFTGHNLMRGAFDSLHFASFSSKMLYELRQVQLTKVRRNLNLDAQGRSLTVASFPRQPVGGNQAVVATTTLMQDNRSGKDDGNDEEEEEEMEKITSPLLPMDRPRSGTFSWEFSPPVPVSVWLEEVSSFSIATSPLKPTSRPITGEEDGEENGEEEASEGTIWSEGEDGEEEDDEESHSSQVLFNRSPTPTPSYRGKEEDVSDLDERDTAAVPSSSQIPTVELPSEYLTRLPGLRFVLNAKPSSLMPLDDPFFSQTRDGGGGGGGERGQDEEEFEQKVHGILAPFGAEDAKLIVVPPSPKLLPMVKEEEGEQDTPLPIAHSGRKKKRRWKGMFGSCTV
ncbi:hypothetical protein BASA81_005373 [Batrachochytrium salamandrivorans]|nr:hypothetical protein BASA81_005373 [Batrachochytrium salamandrivorans]